FIQAEDGIRAFHVTGVQTCALPISLFDTADTNLAQLFMRAFYWADEGLQNALKQKGWPSITRAQSLVFVNIGEGVTRPSEIATRSEERRVGEEWILRRWRWTKKQQR